MKSLKGEPFNRWRDVSDRVRERYGSIGDETCGMFDLPIGLTVIASSGAGWEHVSVSRQDRCPSWDEMVFVQRAFFKDEEWAMQLHPPRSKNISVHPYCLHLWRPLDDTIPTPPDWTVA